MIISSEELAKEIEDQKSKGAEVKEKLVQKEGEAAMLASINKQVLFEMLANWDKLNQQDIQCYPSLYRWRFSWASLGRSRQS